MGDLLVWTLPPLIGPKLAPKGIARGFAPGPVNPPDYGDKIGTPLFFRPKAYKANAEDMVIGSAEMGKQAPRYSSLTLPVTIVSGQGDVIVYNSIHAAGLKRDIPHALSFRVPEAGHMPHWVDPDLVEGIIRAMRPILCMRQFCPISCRALIAPWRRQARRMVKTSPTLML